MTLFLKIRKTTWTRQLKESQKTHEKGKSKDNEIQLKPIPFIINFLKFG